MSARGVGARRRDRARVSRTAAAILLLGMLHASSAAGADTDLERKVKAAFIFNFVKFVTWPPARMPAVDQPYVLCSVDAPEFGAAMTDTVRDKRIEGHPVVVKDLNAGESMAACHVVFAGGGGRDGTATALRGAEGLGILTVHEADAALPSGIVRFFIQDRRVRFEVNTAAAAREHLQLSSRLLAVAERVHTEGPP